MDAKRTEELARKSLELDLQNLEKNERNVFDEYQKILLHKQIDLMKKNDNKPVHITIAERRYLIEQAKSNIDNEHPGSVKMKRDWETATSKNGRPPIGGAQDD